jgi:malonyl CoA-acyl carrier protein transacylase
LLHGAHAVAHPGQRHGAALREQLGLYTSAVASQVLRRAIEPDAALGESFGEIAARECAGNITVINGARTACALNDAYRAVLDQGDMLLVSASEEQTRAVLREINHPQLMLATVNSHQPYHFSIGYAAHLVKQAAACPAFPKALQQETFPFRNEPCAECPATPSTRFCAPSLLAQVLLSPLRLQRPVGQQKHFHSG